MYSFDAVLQILFYAAIVAEAMTAALAAGRRKLDWMAVAMLGAITALGGGTVRDLLLGHYPLSWVANPWLLAISGGAAFVTIALASVVHHFTRLFLFLDAVGLAIFTIIGCEVAIQMKQSLAIVIVAGMITGVAGGVLRDVLCNDVPLLFRGELYATVSIVTGLIFIGQLAVGIPNNAATVIAGGAGLAFRLLAIRFKWEMPKFVYERDGH